MKVGPIVCLLLAVGMAAGVASAQINPPTRQLGRPVVAPADRVSIERFVADPWPLPPSERLVTLRVTVRNTTAQDGGAGETLPSFKLRIVRTSPSTADTPFEVAVPALAAGQAQIIQRALSLEPGVAGTTLQTQRTRTVEFTAQADPDNTLGEQASARANNVKVLPLNFTLNRDVSAAPVRGSLETQMLNYEKARLAGAQFYSTVTGPPTCGFIGQAPPPRFDTPTEAAVVFRVICIYAGSRGTAEAYKNFRLKNGWRIKSIEIQAADPDKNATTLNPAEFQWLARPAENSDDPYMKADLVGHSGSTMTVVVFVRIEGPAGTNPYQ